jgi:hypothetical protein
MPKTKWTWVIVGGLLAGVVINANLATLLGAWVYKTDAPFH